MNISLGIQVFVWIFIALLLSSIFYTIVGGYIQPTFNDMAHNTTFVNETRYEATENVAMNTLAVVLAICIITPFAYILVRLFLKKEPDPYSRGFN